MVGYITEGEIQAAIIEFLRKIVAKDKTLSSVDWLVKLNHGLLDKGKVTTIGDVAGLQAFFLKDK